MRPQIVGAALEKISQDPEIARAMFHILETENILSSQADITLAPKHAGLLPEILSAQEAVPRPKA